MEDGDEDARGAGQAARRRLRASRQGQGHGDESRALRPERGRGAYQALHRPRESQVRVLQARTEGRRCGGRHVEDQGRLEAMGLPLTSPLSMRNKRPQVVVRKRSYGLEGEVAIDQSTGYSKGSMFLNDIREGERVLIVDDVLSTGGTLDAILQSVETIGAIIEAVIVVVEKGPGLKQLQEKYPHIKISSLVRLEMDDGKVVLLDEVI